MASGYRSYLAQADTLDSHVADHASARAGYSEHQTGWAVDVGDGSGTCSVTACFADQPPAVWAAANAHRFGFIVRYPAGAEAITGYAYEPWHLRYVGVEAATEIHDQGITLEEFAGRGAEG
ncbi:M15 family metallopeptidase [Pseudarthrobacter sp. LT1]|uniref:M15 family metallopeptidase n=1 Tax=Pseudarthrobacter sp. LT1 TaxID=3111450 RepID=UPI002D779707|nr:M15 family metallopeptidase [Pseudarthrobacter sp. LT1]WRT16041.1 M15 family metallopeptidase [Pseudarthrobacter sp. LT1]